MYLKTNAASENEQVGFLGTISEMMQLQFGHIIKAQNQVLISVVPL